MRLIVSCWAQSQETMIVIVIVMLLLMAADDADADADDDDADADDDELKSSCLKVYLIHGNLRGPPQCHPPQEIRPK